MEPGALHGHTIAYSFEQTGGIVHALPTILELAERLHIPMGLAMTPQALQLTDFDPDGLEVGLHLHPMDPVLSDRVAGRFKPTHDCLGRYPAEQQAQLIATGREVFEEVIGRSPRLFVAGRWSEDSATASLLRREGFTHDGSAFPGHRSSCADWSRLRRLAQPYSPSAEEYQGRGSEPYVYLPVSRGLWGHPLTPEVLPDVGVSYFKAAFDEARVGEADVVHLYFHSPMALDSRAIKDFEAVLRYAHEDLGRAFASPTALRPSDRPRSRPFPPAYLARMDWTLLKSFVTRGEFGRKLLDVGAGAFPWEGTAAPADPDSRRSGPV